MSSKLTLRAYREDGKCSCSQEDVRAIYEKLTECGVCKKVDAGYKLTL